MYNRLSLGLMYNKRKKRREQLKNSSPNKIRKANTPRMFFLKQLREDGKYRW